MSADVTVTTASATGVLTVPASALRGSDGNYMVMTLGSDGSATPTPVDVGLVTNTAAEIKSGIAEGTTVVTGTASELAGTTNNGQFGGGGFGPIRGAAPGGGATFERAPDVVVETAP
jgi:multidrug efflux pump subunit AcrA (membrane-fusion protein)